ncbi:ArsR/SmtB family transcription factor [Streptodolium elevatio]|uniref:Metalloregulator ArsR/SmtB family transcription factor n=1 Tax=Streptodolium elevatio TaxID=3157996 RepID=A0ABV3DPX3_9ACTN
MRLRFADGASDLVVFGCSAAYEALRSLHVLGNVKSHPLHISWVLTARARMTDELKGEFDRFAFWCARGPLGFPRIWSPTDGRSWSDEIAALQKAPIRDFTEPLISMALAQNGRMRPAPGELTSELQQQALKSVAEAHRASLPAMHELIAEPERFRGRFAEFLDAYWQTCIAPDWPRLEQYLLAETGRCRHLAERGGVPRMLAEALAHVDVTRDSAGTGSGELVSLPSPVRRGPLPMEVTLGQGDQLLFVPSHFAWPKVSFVVLRDRQGDADRMTVHLTYALAEMRAQARIPDPPVDLLKLLRAAGDPTRMKILRLLRIRARSTREVAGLLDLTEAAISKHLKLLADAGWVDQERHSYYVYYRVAPHARDNLVHGLDQLLG